ncbi:MAG: dUTP diphosphatase [Phycisphaerae bacterium]|nr:dUTP diphosphatase [Phycisphaerae bacterium]
MPGPVIQIKKLSPLARLPEYATAGASGMDVHAAIEDSITIPPRSIRMIPLGFAMAIPVGWEAQVRPRSGLASRHGVSLPNTPGTIDADYRGELKVPLINLGDDAFIVEPGMRIAQMVITQVEQCRLVEVEDLDETDRGEGGFGSTGTAPQS